MQRLSFVGDIIAGDQPVLFGHGFDSRHASTAYESIFSGARTTLMQADWVVGNFEAVVKPRMPSEENVGNWSMCCDATIAAALKAANITHVSVANNHTMDYGEEYFWHTVDALQKEGIEIIGLRERPYAFVELNGRRVAIIGISYLPVQILPVPYLFDPSDKEWTKIGRAIASADVTIAYVHWGNEFVDVPTARQISIARQLINRGVDVIIGHHPHILQPACLVDGRPVYFSLGNFISDYWQERFRRSIIVHIDGVHLNDEAVTRCMIDDDGIPHILEDRTAPLQELQEGISDNAAITKARWRVRMEYGANITLNFHRIKGKGEMLRWLGRRAAYLLRYARQEHDRPELVYKHYRHHR